MSQDSKPERFNEAKRAAEEYARDKTKTAYLLEEAVQKAERHKKTLQGIWHDLQALFRLVRAWVRGEYREMPWRTIVFAIAGVIYFVNPFDLVPDFLPSMGFLDDATVVGFVLKSIKADIDDFLAWETGLTEEEEMAPVENHEPGSELNEAS